MKVSSVCWIFLEIIWSTLGNTQGASSEFEGLSPTPKHTSLSLVPVAYELFPEDLTTWSVKYPDSNINCVLLQGSFQFEILSNPDPEQFTVPQSAVAEGTCLTLWGEYQDIKLSWEVLRNNEVHNFTLYLGFISNWTSDYSSNFVSPGEYALNTVTVVYYGRPHKESNNSTLISYSISDLAYFKTPLNHSFSCRPYTATVQVGGLLLSSSRLSFEAFRKRDGTELSSEIICQLAADDEGSSFLETASLVFRWIIIASFILFFLGAIAYVLCHCLQDRFNCTRYRWLLTGRRRSSNISIIRSG